MHDTLALLRFFFFLFVLLLSKVGRTGRHRQALKQGALTLDKIKCDVSQNSDSPFRVLQRWAQAGGMSRKHKLTEALFSNTGRGLMCTRDIAVDEVMVSLPRNLLVTPLDALGFLSSVGPLLPPRELLKSIHHTPALALFLIKIRSLGMSSVWSPYLASLPQSFDNPMFVLGGGMVAGGPALTWLEWLLPSLPEDLQQALTTQAETFERDFQEATLLGGRVGLLVTREEFLWAWFAVNTRCVSFSDPAEPATQALAPFLDYLNHSDTAQVVAGFNVDAGKYEIRTLRPYSRREQAFIFYGPHDNGALYVEYGFTILGNIQNFVCFDEELRGLQIPGQQDSEGLRRVRQQILGDYHLAEKVTSEAGEVSWKLRAALVIRTLTQADYERGAWRRLVLGEVDSLGPESDARVGRAMRQVLERKHEAEEARLRKVEDMMKAAVTEAEREVGRRFRDIVEERVTMVAQLREKVTR